MTVFITILIGVLGFLAGALMARNQNKNLRELKREVKRLEEKEQMEKPKGEFLDPYAHERVKTALVQK